MLVFVCTLVGLPVTAQQIESGLPLSQRMTINLSAGMPGYIADASSGSNSPQDHWWFENNANSNEYATRNFDETSDANGRWQQVGLPYEANIPRTFINQTSGGGQGSLQGQENWYRLHFKIDQKYAGQKFLLEIEGAHTGLKAFVNGTPLKGISGVAANAQATHVVGFIPVVIDLTPYLQADGTSDNVIALDVSRGDDWFEQPGFSSAFRFGQAMAGLFRNVKLVVTNPVHIPLNVYSNQATWGTYVGTVGITQSATSTATAQSAVVEVQTNVLNESATSQTVTLTTQVVDAVGNVVVTAPPVSQTIAPMTAGNFPSDQNPIFSQQLTIPNPTLWYPNNSTFGKPYLYRVYHIVSVNGVVVDTTQTTLGIRTITWDANFPYINGHKHYLWGGSGRYDYPGLGSSVPDEQVWRDLQQFAAGGGNIWRPGHSTSSEEFVDAADAYGVMVIQPSGDNEGAFTNPSADDTQLKTELHRDMIIRDRSHPSIVYWEEDNGGNNPSLSSTLNKLNLQWDNINPRQQASRAYDPSFAYIDECDNAGCESGNKNTYPNNPAFGAEYWDLIGTGRGLAWDNELAFAAPYLKDWRDGRSNNAFGMAQWYFADTPGEVSLWSEYQNNPSMQNYVRSLGYSSVDQNRFPRLLYYIYAANWIPYQIQPVVALAHHWNRAYEYKPGTPLQVNAFSNCPAVRLLINGQAKDPVTGATLADQTPNPWNINVTDLTQSTTVMPAQVHWLVNWASGTVAAECIDDTGNPVAGAVDSRTTAGAENKIVLKVVPNVVKPDGTAFQWTANGSDAAFIEADVVDTQGNLVPTANDNVTFSVSGPATYLGGTQQVVADPAISTYYEDAFSQAHANDIQGVPYAMFHSPGDPELNFEGGLQKIALRSTFTPGTVTVTASANGLGSASAQLTSVAPTAPQQNQAPAIIVPPAPAAVTSGYSATFSVTATGSGTLNYQWYLGQTAIAGATGTSYITPVTTLADSGEHFSVTVTSATGQGAVSSNPVLLTVQAPQAVSITGQPVSQAATVGQTATFSVTATGSPQLTYTWFVRGVQVASGTSNTYTTDKLTTPGTESVYVVVSNPVAPQTSSTATLTVNAAVPVNFTTQPASQIVTANEPVQLTATVAGSSPYTYQWTFTPAGGSATVLASDTQLSNSFNYTISAMTQSNVGSYALVVNNAAGLAATSAAANLILAPPGVNLAYARPATDRNSQQDCTDTTTAPPLSGANCLGANNAVDGSLSTRWASQSAGAPPTSSVASVDPNWLIVDLGSIQSFNTVAINWEAAYAAQYQIQYTNDDPASADAVWQTATTNNAGAGGTETLSFNTVQGRYVRLYTTQRAGQYGYSVWEFQVYNVAQLGDSKERYSAVAINDTLVRDNLLGLTWTNTEKTDAAVGSQFTGVDAANYCSSLSMRLPTLSEALDIAGNNNSASAIRGVWSTWTSTLDPNDANETALVSFDGTYSEKVTNNWPGATLCVSGSSLAQAPVIQGQPQAATVAPGKSAMFTVTATAVPAPTYQWMLYGQPITGATEPTYITPPTTDADTGKQFTVVVTNGDGSVTSTTALLTVSDTATGTGGDGNGNGAGNGAGNTGNNDTAVPGFGTGPVPAGSNLALGKKAISSGDENTDVYPPAAVIDGDTTTRWSSAFADPEWLQIDLGSIMPVGQVVLRWERAYGVQYQIQTSADAENWMTVFTQTSGQGGSENITFAGVNARYVRMNGIQRSTQYGYSLWEFEVYGPVAPTITTQPVAETVTAGQQAQFSVVASGTGPFTYQWLENNTPIQGATAASFTTNLLSVSDSGNTFSVRISNADGSVSSNTVTLTVSNPVSGNANLALYKPTSASGSENGGLQSANATDGDLTTRFSSNFADNAWFEVDLGAPTMVNKTVIYWENAYGKQYQIQMSNDEQTWTPVYVQINGQGGVETLTFNGTVGRYVRLQGVQRNTQYGYSFFEFQLYGADVPNISTQPVSQSVVVGTTATFSVVASGDGPFSYQWLRTGVPIQGATASSYTVSNLQSDDSGSNFSATVSNVSGSITSNQALLTVVAPTPTGPNLALNQPTYSSGNQDNVGLAPALATDGNTATRWGSAFVDPSYLYVDLGASKTINQVILRWENAYGKQYQIQVSNDAQTWTSVSTQTAGQGGTENIAFPPVTARYVRMYGTQRATPYGYSLYEFEVYGPNTAPVITTQPVNASAIAGSPAIFTVAASGSGTLTYQWFRNSVAIPGATAASYVTPALTSTNNGDQYHVVVGSSQSNATVTSSTVTVSVGTYTVTPGFVTVDLNNNTNGKWTNDQIYVTVIGLDPKNMQYAYLKPDGTVIDFTGNDVNAANHITQNGVDFGNYSFTLAQSQSFQLPTFISARAFVSLGAPLYVTVHTDTNGNVVGYTGPDPANNTDPNLNTHFDWYEFNNNNGIYINTTQVDEFGLPLTLDVWGGGGSVHQRVGITETIAQLDAEFAKEVPIQFQPAAMSDLRIFSPGRVTMGTEQPYANYFDTLIASAWSSYATTPLTIAFNNRQFTGTATGSVLTFAEVNPSEANAGETFLVNQPTTPEVIGCSGSMNQGLDDPTTPQQQDEDAVQRQLQNKICSATNRGVLLNPQSDWTNVAAYYSNSPANFYSAFWHRHSINSFAYGFAYDDNNDQSTTINMANPEHMAFGIGW